MRPSMLVQEGESVKKGQALFEDKKNPRCDFYQPRLRSGKSHQSW
ncbi:Na(+)-translocating NADH-quinone reductase subunit A [Morganella morganii IS15]|nr:Na(+)-translocating NADH-quinone reductase subunit A [Morganella morganii IS15]